MSKRTTFLSKPMSFHESLHWCGCDACKMEIQFRAQQEPPLKDDFLSYLKGQYPETAGLLDRTSPEAAPHTDERGE